MSQKIKRFAPKKFSGSKFNPKAHIDALYESKKWRDYSHKFLKHNPKCYACGKMSEVTDHLRAHKGDLKLFWKVDNYIPLCFICHNTITAKFDREFIQKYMDKLKWISDKRSQLGLVFPVVVVPAD